MKNMILFSFIMLVVLVSLCIGIVRIDNRKEQAGIDGVKPANEEPSIARLDDSGTSTRVLPERPQPESPTAPTARAPVNTIRNVPHIGSVQVLNGCGVTGAADKMMEFLRTRNFDVKDVGNAASWNYPATMIIARTPDMSLANELEKILKTGKVAIIRNRDKDLYDVTVVVGQDFEKIMKN